MYMHVYYLLSIVEVLFYLNLRITCIIHVYSYMYMYLCIARNLEGVKFGILIVIRQNKIHHFEPSRACSMACGYKFQLKFPNR